MSSPDPFARCGRQRSPCTRGSLRRSGKRNTSPGPRATGEFSYPSVLVMKDRVLIAHTYSIYQEDPAQAQLISSSPKSGRV